eukprot:SAG31_NODE_2457_length_5661_cov_94.571557_7_plen_239_part_00
MRPTIEDVFSTYFDFHVRRIAVCSVFIATYISKFARITFNHDDRTHVNFAGRKRMYSRFVQSILGLGTLHVQRVCAVRFEERCQGDYTSCTLARTILIPPGAGLQIMPRYGSSGSIPPLLCVSPQGCAYFALCRPSAVGASCYAGAGAVARVLISGREVGVIVLRLGGGAAGGGVGRRLHLNLSGAAYRGGCVNTVLKPGRCARATAYRGSETDGRHRYGRTYCTCTVQYVPVLHQYR